MKISSSDVETCPACACTPSNITISAGHHVVDSHRVIHTYRQDEGFGPGLLPRASLISTFLPAPDEAADGVGVNFAEPDAAGEAKDTGLSPNEKMQLRVSCFKSTGRLARLSARDGRPFRFMTLASSMYFIVCTI